HRRGGHGHLRAASHHPPPVARARCCRGRCGDRQPGHLLLGRGGRHGGVHVSRSAAAMKPFLLLASRAEDAAADAEYEAFCRFGALPPEALHRVRLEAAPMPPIDLDRYSGVIVGGSPFNSCDPPEAKSPTQVRSEEHTSELQSRFDLVCRLLLEKKQKTRA